MKQLLTEVLYFHCDRSWSNMLPLPWSEFPQWMALNSLTPRYNPDPLREPYGHQAKLCKTTKGYYFIPIAFWFGLDFEPSEWSHNRRLLGKMDEVQFHRVKSLEHCLEKPCARIRRCSTDYESTDYAWSIFNPLAHLCHSFDSIISDMQTREKRFKEVLWLVLDDQGEIQFLGSAWSTSIYLLLHNSETADILCMFHC